MPVELNLVHKQTGGQVEWQLEMKTDSYVRGETVMPDKLANIVALGRRLAQLAE